MKSRKITYLVFVFFLIFRNSLSKGLAASLFQRLHDLASGYIESPLSASGRHQLYEQLTHG
jgi:hypothetical protein